MSPAVEKVLEEVRNLTPEERRQLLEALQAAHVDTVDRVFGKYAHVRTSSEEFCAGKAQEIVQEDRRQP